MNSNKICPHCNSEFFITIIMPRKKKQKEDEWFDDCTVCQAMRFADKEGRMPTLAELRRAFKKAEACGGKVGTARSLS